MPDERDLKVKDLFPLRLSKKSFFVLGFLLTSWIRTNTSCIQRTTTLFKSWVWWPGSSSTKKTNEDYIRGEKGFFSQSPSGRRQPAATYHHANTWGDGVQLWEMVISKKTKKLLKRLAAMPGIKWKKAVTPPVLPLPKPQVRKRRGRKSVPVEPAQLKHKKSALEEYIDSLDEWLCPERTGISQSPSKNTSPRRLGGSFRNQTKLWRSRFVHLKTHWCITSAKGLSAQGPEVKSGHSDGNPIPRALDGHQSHRGAASTYQGE